MKTTTSHTITRRALVAGAAAGAVALASAARVGAALPAGGAAQKGPAGVPRPRPDRYRRGLRQRRLCLQFQEHRRAARLQQPDRAIVLGKPERVKYGPAEIELRRHLQDPAAERAGAGIHPRRQLARRPRRAVRHLCRAVRRAGANFVVVDFANVRETDGDIFPAGRSVPSRGGLDLAQRQELRRRSRALYLISRSSGSQVASCRP